VLRVNENRDRPGTLHRLDSASSSGPVPASGTSVVGIHRKMPDDNRSADGAVGS